MFKGNKAICALVLVLALLSSVAPVHGACAEYEYDDCPGTSGVWEYKYTACDDTECGWIFDCKLDIYEWKVAPGFTLELPCERGCRCIVW